MKMAKLILDFIADNTLRIGVWFFLILFIFFIANLLSA